jgi:hypothetical protein
MSVARALYDFDGDSANGELSFRAGDMIDIDGQVSSTHQSVTIYLLPIHCPSALLLFHTVTSPHHTALLPMDIVLPRVRRIIHPQTTNAAIRYGCMCICECGWVGVF